MIRFVTRLLALFVCLLPVVAWSAPVSGERKVLAIIIQFANQSSAPTTADRIRARLLTDEHSTDKVWRESSGGLLGIKSVDVVGPFKIADAGSVCRPAIWKDQARKLAIAAGVAMTGYDHTTYISSAGGCNIGGLGWYGTPGDTWVREVSAGHWTHEFGHNLWLGHAGCASSSAYCDRSDPMGGIYNELLGAPNRDRLGWMPAGTVREMKASGEAMIVPLSAASKGLQVLRVPTVFGSRTYWVSIRSAIGRDARLRTEYRDVVLVHSAMGTVPYNTSEDTTIHSKLAAGAEYVDMKEGVRVSVVDIKPGVSATVRVERSTGVCTSKYPSVTIDPVKQVAVPGETLRYVASVTSKAPETCLSADFKIAPSATEGIDVTAPASVARIAPGQTVQIPLDVTIAPDKPLGAYTVKLQAYDHWSAPTTGKAALTLVAPPPPEPDDVVDDPAPEPAPEPDPAPPVPKDEPQPDPPPVTKPEPAAGSATIIASADTYLSSYHPKNAWGTATTMMQAGSYQPLIRFAVFQSQGGPVPDGATITAATVRLYKTTAYNLTLGLYRIGAEWSEASTLNTSPGWADTPDAQGSVEWEPGWVEFDVSGSLAAAPFGWRIGRITGYTDAVFKRLASREHADPALRPQLVVTWQ